MDAILDQTVTEHLCGSSSSPNPNKNVLPRIISVTVDPIYIYTTLLKPRRPFPLLQTGLGPSSGAVGGPSPTPSGAQKTDRHWRRPPVSVRLLSPRGGQLETRGPHAVRWIYTAGTPARRCLVCAQRTVLKRAGQWPA